MGVWPMVYACLIFVDEKTQTLSAGPSFLTSNGAGVMGLIPYLRLRNSNQEVPPQSRSRLKNIRVPLDRTTAFINNVMVTRICLFIWRLARFYRSVAT